MTGIYLKTSFRHISRSRLYFVINVVGLATGITAMLLAILFWRNEMSYDRFHSNNPHLYRITTTLRESKESDLKTVGATGQVQGPAFKAAVPELKSYTRVFGGEIFSDLIVGSKALKARPMFTDPNFLQTFTFPVIRGNDSLALRDLHSIVLTESTAKRLFNSIEVVGQQISIGADPSFQRLGSPMIVTAVVKDPPETSSLQFDVLLSFKFLQLSFTDEAWLNAYLGTFVTLDPRADIENVIRKFDRVYTKHAAKQLEESITKYNFDPGIKYGLQPITDIHLHPLIRAAGNAESGIINGSQPVYSIIFLVISGFILLMASINFVNISIAASLKRAKEVGIRKISGSNAAQIILQFLTESTILCVLAFFLAIVSVSSLLPFFNELTGKHLTLSEALQPSVFVYFLILLVVVAGATGIYPAMLLSRFRAAEVLYNKRLVHGKSIFGRGLIIFQFMPAIVLLIAALVYYRQMEYMQKKDLGYNPHNIVRTSITGNRDYNTITRFLKNELSKEPSIQKVSFSNPGYPFRVDVNTRNLDAVHKVADENFLPALEIPLLSGRNFRSSDTENSGLAIVNETFVKEAALDKPIGAMIKLGEYYGNKTLTISGVIKDYHFTSLRSPIAPMIFFKNDQLAGDLWIRIDQSKSAQAVAAIEKAFKQAMPDAIFEYSFLEDLNQQYFKTEQRWQKIINIATLCSMLICCLGLFGLAHLTVYRRVKEIGIRKVLGASVSQIVVLLSGSFIKIVGISFLIAAPVAGMIMQSWLGDFAYRIDLGISIFALAALISFGVAIVAVIAQSLRSAIANPVESLRNE